MMMGKSNFTEEFKLDAIKQITERGYTVEDVSKRLGVSIHSLGWMKHYSSPLGGAAKEDQVRRDKAAKAGTGACHRGA